MDLKSWSSKYLTRLKFLPIKNSYKYKKNQTDRLQLVILALALAVLNFWMSLYRHEVQTRSTCQAATNALNTLHHIDF